MYEFQIRCVDSSWDGGVVHTILGHFDLDIDFWSKGYLHMCPRMGFLQTLHINNSLCTNYENVFIELDSQE